MTRKTKNTISCPYGEAGKTISLTNKYAAFFLIWRVLFSNYHLEQDPLTIPMGVLLTAWSRISIGSNAFSSFAVQPAYIRQSTGVRLC